MRKTIVVIMTGVWLALCGCSMQPAGSQNGVEVVFDGRPRIFDESVVYMESPVGQVISREWSNGVTRVVISLDGAYDNLKRTNMAVIVKNGRLHLSAFSGYGTPLAPSHCINGFVNAFSFRWFKFKHLINNITISADRRAERLLARSGQAG